MNKPLGWRSSLLRGSSSRGHTIGHSAPFQDLHRMDPSVCAFFAHLKDDLTAGPGGVFSRLQR
jgi:hypothetical protein